MSKIIVPEMPACPSWCEVRNGHAYECIDSDGRDCRYHARELDVTDQATLAITAEEQEDSEGVVTMDAPIISMFIRNEMVEFTPEQARCLSEALASAADKLDALGA